MRGRVAEHHFRPRLFARKVRLRVDLHGVSQLPPDGDHTLIRWEWIEDISVEDGVVVRSANASVTFPPGAFGLSPEALAERLQAARSITDRPDVLGELAG
jgi:hypothetical protein